MEFFASAVDTLKVLVMAIGCGLGAWGIVNLLEGYGADNPASNIDGTYLLETIFANWDSLWHVKAVYDILATFAFCCKPNQPFGWYEGIQFLVRIERDAMNEWNGIQG